LISLAEWPHLSKPHLLPGQLSTPACCEQHHQLIHLAHPLNSLQAPLLLALLMQPLSTGLMLVKLLLLSADCCFLLQLGCAAAEVAQRCHCQPALATAAGCLFEE
jgi:hypothetical protein